MSHPQDARFLGVLGCQGTFLSASTFMAVADTLCPVVEDLWIWHAYEPRVKADLSSSLIRAASGLVIVDPIDLVESQLMVIRNMGPVVAIVLTNGNHCRSSARYRQRFGAPVLAHPEAVGDLESPVDGTLRAGSQIGGSLEFIELPGAGRGEVALYDPRGRLHLGDALINLESTGFSLLPEKYCLDAAGLCLALQILRLKKVEVITFAHGSPLVTGAQTCLRGLLDALAGGKQAG